MAGGLPGSIVHGVEDHLSGAKKSGNPKGPGSSAGPSWAGRFGLALSATLVGCLLVVAMLRGCAWQMGVRDREFRYESEIGMWRPDLLLGFSNAGNFFGVCHGRIRATTNEHGFRGQAPVSRSKDPGSLRIIGLGDSVMWGSVVDASDSFLGLLQARLRSLAPQAEVINAGVVGFSALQEALLLERLLAEFSPDVVVVNFCENDLLPTEDPYRSNRDFHLHYLHARLAGSAPVSADASREALAELLRIFAAPGPVHEAMASASAQCRAVAVRLFLELPIRRMARLAEAGGVRLVYLLIPPRDGGGPYRQLLPIVRQILEEEQVDCIDFGQELKQAGHLPAADMRAGRQVSAWLTSLGEKLLPDLRAIRLARRIEAVHREQDYVDSIHPSRKGNAIIARRIFDYLMETGELQSVLAH